MSVSYKLHEEDQINEKWEYYKELISKVIRRMQEEADTTQKIYLAVHKLQDLKESLTQQLLRTIIYKDNLLWRDLNAPYDDYIHAEVKQIINQLKSA